MAGFSAADAAFTGFRIVWERPLAVVIWAVVQFVASLAFNLFTAISAGQAVAQMAQLGVPQIGDPRVAMLLQEVAPTYVAVLIGQLVLAAVFYAAMNRAVIRPTENRFGYLQLASDELRQLGLLAFLLLLLLGYYFGVFIVSWVIVGLLMALVGSAAFVMTAVLIPVVVCALIYFGVRLSLASPMTFATRRISIFRSWSMTRGRFWPMLGTYLIALALGLVVFALTAAIAVLSVAILGGGSQQAVASAVTFNPTSVAQILSPAGLVYMTIVSIGAALTSPITMCPPAAIYAALTGGAPAAVSRSFE